jgi:hypothetical protein
MSAPVPVTVLKSFVWIDDGERKVAEVGTSILVSRRILPGLVAGKYVQDNSLPPPKPPAPAKAPAK